MSLCSILTNPSQSTIILTGVLTRIRIQIRPFQITEPDPIIYSNTDPDPIIYPNTDPEPTFSKYMIRIRPKHLDPNTLIKSKVHTICPRSSDPFYIVSYCIKWVTTSWNVRTRCARVNRSFLKINFKFRVIDLNKCLEQIMLPISL